MVRDVQTMRQIDRRGRVSCRVLPAPGPALARRALDLDARDAVAQDAHDNGLRKVAADVAERDGSLPLEQWLWIDGVDLVPFHAHQLADGRARRGHCGGEHEGRVND